MTEEQRNDLAAEFMPEVPRIAEELFDGNMPLEDLIQEGYIGILEGIDSLDEDSAAWSGMSVDETVDLAIRDAIQRAQREYSELLREDDRLVAQVELLNDSIDRLTEEFGTKPNIDEIANDLKIPQETVLSILKLTGETPDDETFQKPED